MSRTRHLNIDLHGNGQLSRELVTFVNPGEWFKKRWLISVGAGFFCLFYIAEWDCEQDVLDALVDSNWGHIVKSECDHENTDDCTFAGNYGEHVDLDDIRILRRLT